MYHFKKLSQYTKYSFICIIILSTVEVSDFPPFRKLVRGSSEDLLIMSMRLSGLQRDVLALYKALLKSALSKQASQDGSKRSGALYQLGTYNKCDYYYVKCVSCSSIFYLTTTVTKEFREKAANVARTDYRTIEHLLRYGYKQKKLIEMPGFTGATAVKK